MLNLKRLGLSLVPGTATPPAPSWSSENELDIVEYAPELVASVLLAQPGALLLDDGSDDWYRWNSAWDLHGATVGVGFTLFELEDGRILWGGSGLSGAAPLDDLLSTWQRIRDSLSGVWLLDAEGELYTPEGFRERYGHG